MKECKPFLKWAGGKTQLIPVIEKVLHQDFKQENFTYIEPFVGSGAILFWMLNNFPNLKKAVINDINVDLINTYKVVATEPKELVSMLMQLQNEYHNLQDSEEEKKVYYYSKRELFNTRKENKTAQATLFIFLNRTCFNGLYRVNSHNLFNVPMGSYHKPTICDAENILAVSEALKRVEIVCGDFENTLEYASENSFFYFDPPYKPLSTTSNFNAYSKEIFNDDEQMRLSIFCRKISALGHKWILSNSDVRSNNADNNFFDEMYEDYNISRVEAKRAINSNGAKRGKLSELLITNYSNDLVAL